MAAAIALIALRILWRLYPASEYALFSFDAYVDIRPWWVFAPAMFATGVGAAKMSTKGARIGVGMVALLLWVVSGQRMFLTYMLPPEEMKGTADNYGIVRQTTDYTCGAAAAATVLTKLGVPATEREMAHPKGTEPPYPMIVLAKGHIQHPMHGLNTPMTTHRLRETLTTQIPRAQIISHLETLTAIIPLGIPSRIANRLQPRPLLLTREVLRRLRQKIQPCVRAAMAA